MKRSSVLAAVAGLFISCTAFAQNNPSASNTGVINTDSTVVRKYSRSNDVIQSDGRVISSKELQRMGTRNINNVANTVTGVQSVDGGVPNIRGAAASGTAYFVDGVRVYGSMPKW